MALLQEEGEDLPTEEEEEEEGSSLRGWAALLLIKEGVLPPA